jgi:LysR family nitrogen assimilation transcriptional regulator
MDLRHVRAFVAAYEKRSITAAAVTIYATQPGLSVQIAALEAELRSKLFERHARGLEPTFAGERFYPLAVSILRDVNHAVGTMRSLSKSVAGAFSIGVPPTLSKAILAPVLSQFADKYPEVEIRIVEAYSGPLLSLLENKDVDCALVMHIPDHPEIRFTPIYDDRFVLVSGPRLGIVHGVSVALNKEPRLKLVIPSLRHALHRLLEPQLKKGRILPERLIEIDGLSGTLKFIEASDWAGLLPYAAVHDDVDEARLRVNPIEGEEIKIEYFVAQLGTEFLLPAAQIFIDTAAAVLTEIKQKYHRTDPPKILGSPAG